MDDGNAAQRGRRSGVVIEERDRIEAHIVEEIEKDERVTPRAPNRDRPRAALSSRQTSR